MQVDWELSQSFVSDSQGVRSACVLPAAPDSSDAFRLITGNQGGRLCEFGVPSANLYPISFQHDHAVTALLSDTASNTYVTGCKDSHVRIFDGAKHALVTTLKGHEKPVTSLAWCGPEPGKFLVSGSWDGTAKVWNMHNHSLLATLSGHENSVCVASLTGVGSTNEILQIATGSAGIAQNNKIQDYAVRVWTVNVHTGLTTLQRTVANDHDGPIRDVCLVPTGTDDSDDTEMSLASCSNDGTVKLRELPTAEAVTTLSFLQQTQQHPPMLLSVASILDQATQAASLVASAEDGHVIVWDLAQQQQEATAQQPQIIRHVSCVWKIVALPNGDFATCCDDGRVRIFTRTTERQAPVAERDEFAQAVQEAMQKQQNGPSPDEVAKLPNWETNGQQTGKSEGQVQLFQKNGVAIAAQWSAASRTWIEVGQVMGGNKDQGLVDGVKYDHVLPIEVDQTGGGVANLDIGYNNGENPFVAAQRFIDSHVLPQHHLAQIADYIQQRLGQQGPTLGATTLAAGPAATTGTPIAAFQYLPMKGYKTFELSEKLAATTLDKMKNKIQEFGKLSDEQLGQVGSLMVTLAASSRYHSSKVQDSELNVVAHMLEQFPPAEAFPALDLARLTVVHPDATSKPRCSYWDRVFQQTLQLCQQSNALKGPAAVAIPMLSLRLFANAFKGGPGSSQAAGAYIDGILTCVEAHGKSSNKNVRLSVATVLYNLCFYLRSNVQSRSFAHRIVPLLNDIVENKAYETEALTRALVALGTLIMSSKDAKEAANSLFMASKVEMAASPHGVETKDAAKEVYAVLQ